MPELKMIVVAPLFILVAMVGAGVWFIVQLWKEFWRVRREREAEEAQERRKRLEKQMLAAVEEADGSTPVTVVQLREKGRTGL